jgi:thiamine-monophosphate kinase
LGGSAAGLALLRAGKSLADAHWQPLLSAHLDPQPRLKLGQFLAQSGLVHSMMDMSDGLSTDLAQLCAASGTGAVIAAEQVPSSALLKEAAQLLQHDPLPWLLSGGEDYELLFTAASANSSALQQQAAAQDWSIHPIGTIRAEPGIILRQGKTEATISFQGFDHFTSTERSCTGINLPLAS